jgi:hypothetical protein
MFRAIIRVGWVHVWLHCYHILLKLLYTLCLRSLSYCYKTETRRALGSCITVSRLWPRVSTFSIDFERNVNKLKRRKRKPVAASDCLTHHCISAMQMLYFLALMQAGMELVTFVTRILRGGQRLKDE